MDSDASVEGDGDNEQSPNRSWTSNNSGGSPSSSGSPDRNSDDRSSTEEEERDDEAKPISAPPPRPASARKRYASSSEPESSPEAPKNSDGDSDGNSSPDAAPTRCLNNDDDGASTDQEDQPQSPVALTRKHVEPVAESDDDDETTPDMNDADESSDDGMDAAPVMAPHAASPGRRPADSSPDSAVIRRQPLESASTSPDAKTMDEDEENNEDSDRETSLTAKQPNVSATVNAASDMCSPTGGPTSPENGAWGSSDSDKTAPNSPASPPMPAAADERDFREYDKNVDDEESRQRLQDYDQRHHHNNQIKKVKRSSVESDVEEEESFENVNGDAFPKTPPSKRRSPSALSDRSNAESSLDSVSPTQFEQIESNKTDEDEMLHAEEIRAEDVRTDEEEEEADESKKGIIHFADDLSDVSDIESNDSFGGEEPAKEKDEEEEVKIDEPVEEPEPPPVQTPSKEIVEDKHEDAVSLHVEGEEQLDFEAEEGECSPKPDAKKILVEEKEEVKPEKEQSDLEEGELTDDNDAKAEEIERPVCRFFSRGHCTWGSNCRFIHPGVMDKGNYSMFDTVRPIVTPGGPPPNPSGPMVYPMFLPPMAHPHLPGERGMPPPAALRKEEQPAESAWERGLRQAKEMIRKSSKRKETEVDFEDKKMNLTLNQDEIDKENDYYSRHSSSPVKSPDLAEKWKMEAEAKSHRADPFGNELPPPVPHGGPDVPPLGYYPPLHHGLSRPEYWNPHRMGGLPYEEYGLRGPHIPYGPDFYSAAGAGRRYMHPNSYYPPRAGGVGGPPAHLPEVYDRRQKHKQYPGSGREVIVQKNDKPYKDGSPARYRNRREDSPIAERTRDDEWADPWMRTNKSPASGRRRRRKNTYSSGSSYSSSSESSRSSSRSSVSSRSRSKARSSGSRSSRSASETANRKKPMQFKLSPSSRPQLAAPSKKNVKSVSPSLLMERRAATERAMHMNPPPPSPKVKARPHSPSNTTLGLPTTSPPKPKSGLPDRLLAHSKAAVAAAMRSARSSSRSSKSSSGSSSSDSSSDSSDSSGSSSSSSKSRTPPIRAPKRTVPDEHVSVSQTVKAKAMDALKLSGQKQQIKLTLKGSGGPNKRSGGVADGADSRKERQPLAGKKRAAESSDSGSDSDRASPAKKSAKLNQKKGPPSRRDELLKQLKAVEDAIARKRSKNL